MPGGDRTGPMGMGPMTGRGLGYCGGSGVAGGGNRGFRGGRGGRGHRHMFYATGLTGWQQAMADAPAATPATASEPPSRSPQDEVESLRSQLDEVKRRLAEIEAARTQQ